MLHYQVLAPYIHQKIEKMPLKIIALSYQDQHEMKNLNYLMDDFEYIIKNLKYLLEILPFKYIPRKLKIILQFELGMDVMLRF